MILEGGDMSAPSSPQKSDILQHLSPRLSKLLDEHKRGEVKSPFSETGYLDDVFHFSAQNKPD